MKLFLRWSLSWMFGLALPASAENFFSPLDCKPSETSFLIQNTSSEAQSFWFQFPGSTPFTESHISVKAKGQLRLPLSEALTDSESAIAVKTHTSSLKFQTECRPQQTQSDVTSLESPWQSAPLTGTEQALDVRIVNLAQQPQKVSIEVLAGSNGDPTSGSVLWKATGTLSEDFKSRLFQIPVPKAARIITIHGEGRLSLSLEAAEGPRPQLVEERALMSDSSSAPRDTRYFLFQSTDPDVKTSFIVPMKDPGMIQESLRQIRNPQLARLFVGRIEKSLKGLNRDFSSVHFTPWSWEVVEAQNYADFAHISCDGTPRLVEERLSSWLLETGGTICFWSYRIVREVSFKELQPSPSSSPLALPSLPRKR